MIGFLGGGTMGEAIFSNIIRQGCASPNEIFVADIDSRRKKSLSDLYHVCTGNAKEMLTALQNEDSKLLFLCVKPYQIEQIVRENYEMFDGLAVISIMAGWTTEKLSAILPKSCRIMRVMPNTCAKVGMAMTVLSTENKLTPDEFTWAKEILNACGKTCELPEHLFDVATGLSGSGPAYVYLFIEGLIAAGVKNGLPWAEAKTLALQTILGSTQMVLQSENSPHDLCDQVCTPGGTTIDAVHTLISKGFEGIIMDAVTACTEKSKSLGKK